MRTWQRFRHAGTAALLAAVTWFALWGMAMAQAPVPVPGQPGQPMGMRPGGMMPKKPEGSGEYVTSYALVLAGVGLGLLLVCRTSNRRDRARPEQYEESKVTATD